MPQFAPITTPENLPEVQTLESEVLDFKEVVAVDAASRYALAKDVAAFANTQGGTLIIGAAHDGDRLARYTGLSADQARDIRRGYEEAVRDRCRPIPRLECNEILKEGQHILAVNVPASVGQLVGVELKHPRDLQRAEPGAYVYPARVGSHNRLLQPEELVIYMDAAFRRKVLILQGGIGERCLILGRTQIGHWMATAEIREVRTESNAVVLTMDMPQGPPHDITLPFDTMDTVWRDLQIRIRIPGWFDSVRWLPHIPAEFQRERLIYEETMPPMRVRTIA
jgi:hypothetical protein